jgi:predicted ATP-dependent endonuclease of OLD family
MVQSHPDFTSKVGALYYELLSLEYWGYDISNMRLTSITIRNFRCLDFLTVNVGNFTTLIGPNNCGKSSVLRAIEIFLNQVSPSPDEWRSGHQGEPITIEGTFEKIEDWERSTSGIAGIVWEEKIRLRLSLSINADNGKIEKTFEAFKPEETIRGWADSWNDLDADIRTKAAELNINGQGFRNANKKEQLRQAVRDSMSERVTQGQSRWTSENISINAALQQAMPQAQIIPAMKDAREDGKPGKTSFGFLIEKIILPAIQSTGEYGKFLEAVDALRTKLSAADESQLNEIQQLVDLVSKRISSIIEAKVLLTMETPDASKFIGSNTVLSIDDGTRTPIGLQGNGLQRSLVFALLEVLAMQNAKVESGSDQPNRVRSTVLLFEEPELFLHPHIMRLLKRALQIISQKADWQVIVTTHSPFLIDIGSDYSSLVVFKRANSTVSPTVCQLAADPFEGDDESERDRNVLRALLDFHPTVCEAFFAQRTILVEGDSEMALLVHQPRLYVMASLDVNQRNLCTVVSCAGKWTIPPIANLLKRFEIPFRIIHDKDAKGRSESVLATVSGNDPYAANARIAKFADNGDIFMVDDTLEDLLWTDGTRYSTDKPYQVWNRVKEICDINMALNDKLKAVLKFAFQWD